MWNLTALTLACAAVGCTAGYRRVNVREPVIDGIYLLGGQAQIGLDHDRPRPYAGGALGILSKNTEASDEAPGGTDEWYGVLLEGEGGMRFPLLRSSTQELWTSVGGQLSLVRSAVHKSGPSGEHDHYEDGHELHRFVGGGLAGRLGYSHRLGAEGRASLGVDVAAGVTSLGGLGRGVWIEIGLLTLRW